MDRREPPATEAGWYVLHDLRRIDWDAWRGAPDRHRRQALVEGVRYLRDHENLADVETEEGGSAVFSVFGHEADLLIVHLRPTTVALDLAERRFEGTTFAEFTERADSYLSVTEVSAYTTGALEEGGLENIEDAGLRSYLRSRLYPDIPDAAHVCFYPMDKRRGPEHNWYDLPFDDRAELMSSHGEIGREYAGDVTQIITGSVGLDDYEWGVTLFADDPTAIKDLLYEMRFDPSTSRYAEFGPFYFGRRFPPEDLEALLAGDPVPSGEGQPDSGLDVGAAHRGAGTGVSTDTTAADADTTAADADTTAGAGNGSHAAGEATSRPDTPDHPENGETRPDHAPEADAGDGDDGGEPGGSPTTGETPHEPVDREVIEQKLLNVGIRIDDYPDAGFALVFPASTDAKDLVDPLEELRGNFDHYDTHVLTTVRAGAGRASVVSLWANQRAADTASGFLGDLSGVQPGIGGPLADGDGGADEADGGTSTDEDAVSTGGGASLREELSEQGIYAGQPHGQDVFAMVVYSTAPTGELEEELDSLRERFGEHDSHVKSAVYENRADAEPPDTGPVAAVVSIWESREAAAKAGEVLADLPGVVGRADEGDGFETLGMFYTVEPEYREDFHDRFETVGDLLDDMEGHRETALLVNREDDNDMFVASRWRSKDDAMEFFRSDAFRDTVDWGREVLADRPRHVFLA